MISDAGADAPRGAEAPRKQLLPARQQIEKHEADEAESKRLEAESRALSAREDKQLDLKRLTLESEKARYEAVKSGNETETFMARREDARSAAVGAR